MAYPWFSIIALALVAVLALLAVGTSVAVWRIRSLAAAYRCGLILAIAGVAAARVSAGLSLCRPCMWIDRSTTRLLLAPRASRR
jgi:hypothetical protein